MSMLSYGTSGDSRIMSLMADLYSHNLESSKKQMRWYEQYQLPYEKDFWDLSKQYLPSMFDMQQRAGDADIGRVLAQTGLLGAQSSLAGAQAGLAGAQGQKVMTEKDMLLLQLAAQRQLNQPQVDYQLAQIGNQMEMLPYVHAFGLEGIAAQREMLPYNTEAGVADARYRSGMSDTQRDLLPYGADAQKADMLYKSALARSHMGLLPHQHEAAVLDSQLRSARSESGLRLNPYEESAQLSGLLYNRDFSDMNRRMLPLAEQSMQSGLSLEHEGNQAARYLLPGQTMLTAEDIAMQRALIPQRQYAQQRFFHEADQGINPDDWAARAAVDVGAAYAGSDGALRRDAARMGVDPSSGRFANAQGGYGLNMARDLAQASTLGRRAGEDENWKRLTMAAQMARQGG